MGGVALASELMVCLESLTSILVLSLVLFFLHILKVWCVGASFTFGKLL